MAVVYIKWMVLKKQWKKIKTSWGDPSDEILIAKIADEEICFIPPKKTLKRS